MRTALIIGVRAPSSQGGMSDGVSERIPWA
jgi:hypothetical protein